MNTNTKLIALTIATLIALATLPANAAANLSDGAFSWPTDYKSQSVSEGTSTFDGKIKNLEIKKPTEKAAKTKKRK